MYLREKQKKPARQSESADVSIEVAANASGPEYGANVMVLYHDLPALAWAREMCDRVTNLVGGKAMRRTWWKINDLRSPAVLAGAVSTALRADVIVVSAGAAEVLPLPFYVWVDSWLPYRPHGAGALMALITRPRRPTDQSDRLHEYLRLVARHSRLDFLLEERRSEPAPNGVARKIVPNWPVPAAGDGDEARVPANITLNWQATAWTPPARRQRSSPRSACLSHRRGPALR